MRALFLRGLNKRETRFVGVLMLFNVYLLLKLRRNDRIYTHSCLKDLLFF